MISGLSGYLKGVKKAIGNMVNLIPGVLHNISRATVTTQQLPHLEECD